MGLLRQLRRLRPPQSKSQASSKHAKSCTQSQIYGCSLQVEAGAGTCLCADARPCRARPAFGRSLALGYNLRMDVASASGADVSGAFASACGLCLRVRLRAARGHVVVQGAFFACLVDRGNCYRLQVGVK